MIDNIYLMKQALRAAGEYGNVLSFEGETIIWKDGATPIDISSAVALLRRDNHVRTVKAEARKRIDAVAPVWKQVNTVRENPSDPMFKKIDAIREKSELIEAHLATLTDGEAGKYDIENSPLWD